VPKYQADEGGNSGSVKFNVRHFSTVAFISKILWLTYNYII